MRYHSLKTCCQRLSCCNYDRSTWGKPFAWRIRIMQVWLMWLQFLSSWQSQGGIFDRAKAVQVSAHYLWRWFRMLYKRQKNPRDWQWGDAKIILIFCVIKMYALKLYELELWIHWYYSLSLILTQNDDTLILTPNDVILTSTILAHFLVTLVHYVSSRRRTMPILFRSISELIRMPRKHWWIFYLHQWIFLF
jgi:hypothetical protein